MTNAELISTIRKEIISRIDKRHLSAQANNELVSLLSFLSTLESEKPMEQEGLEEEIERCVIEPYYDLNGVAVKGATAYITVNDVADIARHFAEWGYLRAAEKYNEIEYNRQRAEESVQNDLEEAAEEYFQKIQAEFLRTLEHPTAKDCFIAGAKWQAEQDEKDLSEKNAAAYQLGLADKEEQMLKEAVEGKIIFLLNGDVAVNIGDTDKYNLGQKIRVIVLPKED